MFELNRDGTRAIMPINDMANICGYFLMQNLTTVARQARTTAITANILNVERFKTI